MSFEKFFQIIMTTLIIHSDLNCFIYIDTELHGAAKANMDYTISLERGAYWIECISQDNDLDRIDFDFRTDGSEYTELCKIALKPIRYKRLVSQYDYVGKFRCGFAEVQKIGNTMGYINCDGDIVYEDAIPFGDNLLCVCKDKRWGILNSTGYVVNLRYRAIQPIGSSSVAIFLDGEKCGLINLKGEILLPAKYDYLENLPNVKLILAQLNGKCGLVDYDGYKLTPLKYSILNARDNFIEANIGGEFIPANYMNCVKLNGGKWGILNLRGEETIECKYDSYLSFNDDLARVEINGKWGFINKIGNEVIPCKYDLASDFTDGLSRVKINGKWGFIDKIGNEVIPCRYDLASNFTDGLSRVKINGKWGFIDKIGNEVIPCKYDRLSKFTDGLSIVKINGKYGFIDKTGAQITSCKYDLAKGFDSFSLPLKEGMIRIGFNGKCGFLDKYGYEAIPCKYDCVGYFAEGLACVRKNKKCGFIDKAGNEIIPCKYDKGSSFSEGLAGVVINDKWGFIDKTGNVIIPCVYDHIQEFRNGIAEVVSNNKVISIDKNGNVIPHCDCHNKKETLKRVPQNDLIYTINQYGLKIKLNLIRLKDFHSYEYPWKF